jgi:hypothetical protein
VLHTCDWSSASTEDDESIGSFQNTEVDFELGAFDDDDDDDKESGSERDVEYMEQMMTILISARGAASAILC